MKYSAYSPPHSLFFFKIRPSAFSFSITNSLQHLLFINLFFFRNLTFLFFSLLNSSTRSLYLSNSHDPFNSLILQCAPLSTTKVIQTMPQEMEPDCFSIGCLYCDRFTTDSYCSQSCRLASIDTSSTTCSEPSSPKSTAGGFYLPPAFNFQSYRRPSVHSETSASSPKLSPSSSRSSLKNELSLQAQHELLYYTMAFDRSREWKRRMTH